MLMTQYKVYSQKLRKEIHSLSNFFLIGFRNNLACISIISSSLNFESCGGKCTLIVPHNVILK